MHKRGQIVDKKASFCPEGATMRKNTVTRAIYHWRGIEGKYEGNS